MNTTDHVIRLIIFPFHRLKIVGRISILYLQAVTIIILLLFHFSIEPRTRIRVSIIG